MLLLVGPTAFVFSSSLDSQFTLPKLVAFSLSMVVFAVVWATRAKREIRVPLPRGVGWAVVANMVWWLATIPFAVHPRTEFWGAVGRGNGLVQHVSLMALFAGIASIRLSSDEIRGMLRAFLAVLVLLSAYALVQASGFDVFVWPNLRPGSTIGHPVPLAAILALGVPIGFALALDATTRRGTLLTGVAASVTLFALGTTLSRGPWIGAAVGALVTGVVAFRRGAARRARTFLIAGGVAVVAATIVFGSVRGARISERMSLLAHATTDPSFMNRFEYFGAAAAMVRARPIAGAGFESFGLLFPPLRPVEAPTVDEDTIPTMVHNGPLQMAVATGVPGVILWLCLNATILFVVWRAISRGATNESDVLRAGLLGALVSFQVQDLSGWEEISSSVFFWTMAGIAVASCATRNARHSPRVWPRRLVTIVASSAVVAFGTVAWTVWQEVSVDRAIHAARAGSSAWNETSATLDALRARVAFNGSYLDRIAVVYLDRMRIAPDLRTYHATVEVLKRARTENRFDPYVGIHTVDLESIALLARLKTSPSDQAVAAARALTAMDPNNPTVHETLARFRLAAGDPTAALDAVHAARALRPKRPGLRLLEGDILRATGDRAGALAAYRAETALHDAPDSVWIAAQEKVAASLLEAGDKQAALRETSVLLSKAPHDGIARQLLEAATRE